MFFSKFHILYLDRISEELRQNQICVDDDTSKQLGELINDLETCKKVVSSADYYLNTGKLYYPNFGD